jgi:hypothetical protein
MSIKGIKMKTIRKLEFKQYGYYFIADFWGGEYKIWLTPDKKEWCYELDSDEDSGFFEYAFTREDAICFCQKDFEERSKVVLYDIYGVKND